GNFGVVTSFTVTPHAGDLMAVANLGFPYDRLVDVLDGVGGWVLDAPRTIGGGAFVTAPDAAPGAVPTVAVSLASRGTPAELDADRMAGQLRNLELHLFGGAANDPGRTETAYVHRDALFSVNYRVTIPDPARDTAESRAVARRWVDAGFAVLDPMSAGETYQ